MTSMSKTYFITATGTDLGKTWLAAGIGAACRARGVPVRALKPVLSGFDAAQPMANDAGVLLAKVGAGATANGAAPPLLTAIAAISPWRFAAPLSPDLAAAREGRHISFAALVDWCRNEIAIPRGDSLLLIEGIGGAMVPLDARHTVRDWIAALDVPVLLVAGSYLGALSHTLTALAALAAVGVVPAAVIVNESVDRAVSLADTCDALAPHLGSVPLHTLQRDDTAGLARLTERLLAGTLSEVAAAFSCR